MGCGAAAVASVCKHARTNSSASDRPKQRRFEPAKIETHGLSVSANPATTAVWRYSIKCKWVTPQQWRAISLLRMDGDNQNHVPHYGIPVVTGGARGSGVLQSWYNGTGAWHGIGQATGGCTPELVRALMRALGLVACQPLPWRHNLTEPGPAGPIPDLLARDFTEPMRPEQNGRSRPCQGVAGSAAVRQRDQPRVRVSPG